MDGTSERNSGEVYEQAVVKTVAGFFRGSSKHLFGVTRFGTPGSYVRSRRGHADLKLTQGQRVRLVVEPIAEPEEVLALATEVYEGLTTAEIDAIDEHDRRR